MLTAQQARRKDKLTGGRRANLPSKSLLNEEFLPHEALEDVCALHRLLFQSPLVLTVEDIVNKSNAKPASFAFEDMVFLDERFQHLQTFRD